MDSSSKKRLPNEIIKKTFTDRIFIKIQNVETKIRKNITASTLSVKIDISTHFLSVAKISPLFK